MVINLPPGKVSGQGTVRDVNGTIKTGQEAPKQESKQEHDNGSNADQRR